MGKYDPSRLEEAQESDVWIPELIKVGILHLLELVLAEMLPLCLQGNEFLEGRLHSCLASIGKLSEEFRGWARTILEHCCLDPNRAAFIYELSEWPALRIHLGISMGEIMVNMCINSRQGKFSGSPQLLTALDTVLSRRGI